MNQIVNSGNNLRGRDTCCVQCVHISTATEESHLKKTKCNKEGFQDKTLKLSSQEQEWYKRGNLKCLTKIQSRQRGEGVERDRSIEWLGLQGCEKLLSVLTSA